MDWNNLKSFTLPRPHLVIDNFLTEKENHNFYSIIEHYEPQLKRGRMLKDGITLESWTKRNWNVGIGRNEIINRTLQHNLFTPDLKKYFLEHRDPIYQTILDTNTDDTLISVYKDGDYYGYHKDLVHHLTAVYMLCKEPQTFSGGDFVLKYNNEVKAIAFKNNRLLLFPGTTDHAVKIVRTKTDKLEDARISIQYWAHRR